MGRTLDMDGSAMMVESGDRLSFEDMRPEERAIVKALEDAHKTGSNVLRISEIMSANDWDMVEEHECPESHCEVCASALRLGNSKVRNNLRRLMRYGVVTRPADGSYALTEESKPVFPGSPRELNDDESAIIRRIRTTEDEKVYKIALKLIEPIRRGDCTFYSTCLDQAISGQWEGFSCASCTAYSAPDYDQAVSDVLALRALDKAAEMIEEHGKISRVRGVKPGADAKRTPSHLADSKTID